MTIQVHMCIGSYKKYAEITSFIKGGPWTNMIKNY
jgi:hypothetical protein